MNILLPAMLRAWTPLLGSLVPLLLALLCFTATAYLLTFPQTVRTSRRKQSDLLLAFGNLLAITCWVLVYADRLSLWEHPWWDYAAPLGALATLLLLPACGWAIAARRAQLHLQLSEKLIYGFCLTFQALSLFPGLYALGIYLLLIPGVA